jgi:hypothetical protein
MLDENKIQNKAVKKDSVDNRMISYIGHKAEVYVSADGGPINFARNKAVPVPNSVAEGLLKQPHNFKEV